MWRVYYGVLHYLSPFARVCLRLVSRATGLPRARVVVTNSRDEILLVRNAIGADKWALPGGGVNRGEEPVRAAERELYEELRIEVTVEEDALYLPRESTGASYDAILFHAQVDDNTILRPEKFEIREVKWFALDNLPDNLEKVFATYVKQLANPPKTMLK